MYLLKALIFIRLIIQLTVKRDQPKDEIKEAKNKNKNEI